MPEVSRFYGIIIKMLFNDNDKHHKPHVHVYYGENEASIALDGELLQGKLPLKQYRMVVAGWQFMRTNCMRHGIMRLDRCLLKRLNH